LTSNFSPRLGSLARSFMMRPLTVT
jgi:hypothetical protein